MSRLNAFQTKQGIAPGFTRARNGLLERRSTLGSHLCVQREGMERRAATPALSHDLSRVPTFQTQLAHTRVSRSRQSTIGKGEAVYNQPPVRDDKHKVEDGAGTGALIGLGIGAGAGALAGGLLGGGLGALVGVGAGGLIGAGIGALIGGARGGGIRWTSANYAADNSNGSSTTIERPFNVRYKAVADKAKHLWRLVVDSIEGTVDIRVHTGGSRDPFTLPPATEAEAKDAVTDMKGYYVRGSRGAWHTESASKAHEEHHYREWKCSSEHYWPLAKASIESLTVPLSPHPSEGSAIATMRAGTTGADAKVQAFQNIAHQYWFTLSDSAGARPYAAGQRVLNNAVRYVQDLARSKGWTVAQGIDNPSPEPPCYQPYPPFTP